MVNFTDYFNIFQNEGRDKPKVTITGTLPTTENNAKFLAEKYPEMSEQIIRIWKSFKPLKDQNDNTFFEGTFEQNGKKTSFVNYINHSWNDPDSGRNFILIPGQGIQLFNTGDYNGKESEIEGYLTYEQNLSPNANEFQEISSQKDMGFQIKLVYV